MINRNENGEIVSVDKLSEITAELKKIEKKLSEAMKEKDSLTEEEEKSLAADAADMKALFSAVNPDVQKGASPLELMGYLKQVVRMKELAEKIKDMKND